MPRKTYRQMVDSVDRWNSSMAIGAAVAYRSDVGTTIYTVTRSRAELLGGHTAVVWLQDVRGCVLLDRVTG